MPISARTFGRIVLVAAPWPMFSRPSIQLAVLKAYVRRRFPDIEVAARHFYLQLAASTGYPVYSAVSQKSWVSETVYAALLYPERFSIIEKLFHRESRNIRELSGLDFKAFTEKVKSETDAFVAENSWNGAGLVGFSVCLCQMSATLYLVRAIKQAVPDLPVVIGGSMVAGQTGRDLLGAFPEIDYVVAGEGEIPLGRLIQHLRSDAGRSHTAVVPGVFTRRPATEDRACAHVQIAVLDQLPVPDFDDYHATLQSLGADNAFFPTLPMEMSRGCWWRKARDRYGSAACAFCNLNLQWDGYRTKTPGRAAREIDALTTRYRTLSVAFVDNLLPVKDSETIFHRLGRLKKDFRLFGEIRAVTAKRVLEAMHTAGLSEVQIGIEALSTPLLKKMSKGTTAIRNIEIMKDCEELGIAHPSNLIVCFPGSDRRDVVETLHNLSFLGPFQPLKTVAFWLGLDSPVFRNPRGYGIVSVFNHPNYARIFPPEIAGAVRFTIQSYRGDRMRQEKRWQPVVKAVSEWKKSYAALHATPFSGPILSFRDGGDFMVIRQRRPNADPMTHRLTGTGRSIYLYCRQTRSMRRILDRFAGAGQDGIEKFLRMMLDKKLMFREDDRYLSLAVRQGNKKTGRY